MEEWRVEEDDTSDVAQMDLGREEKIEKTNSTGSI